MMLSFGLGGAEEHRLAVMVRPTAGGDIRLGALFFVPRGSKMLARGRMAGPTLV
jgi:hypothetical protein